VEVYDWRCNYGIDAVVLISGRTGEEPWRTVNKKKLQALIVIAFLLCGRGEIWWLETVSCVTDERKRKRTC
jgi:hypothetical protein